MSTNNTVKLMMVKRIVGIADSMEHSALYKDGAPTTDNHNAARILIEYARSIVREVTCNR